MRICTFILLLVAMAPSVGAPLPERKGEVPFPTRVGTKWVYLEDDKEICHVLTKAEMKDDRVVIEISQKKGEELSRIQSWVLTKTGLYFTDGDGEPSTDKCWLKLPAKAGDRWKFELLPGATASAKVVGEEEVEVPAGKYKAIRVEWDVIVDDKVDERVVIWHVPGIGEVKKTVGNRKTTVLKSFTSEK